MDVHLDVYVVVRIIDGNTPQPPQRFKPKDFLAWCAKQLTLAKNPVHLTPYDQQKYK